MIDSVAALGLSQSLAARPTGATAEDYGYKDWDLDQPVGSPDLNCVYVVNTDSGRWRVAPCDNPKYGYFCEATP